MKQRRQKIMPFSSTVLLTDLMLWRLWTTITMMVMMTMMMHRNSNRMVKIICKNQVYIHSSVLFLRPFILFRLELDEERNLKGLIVVRIHQGITLVVFLRDMKSEEMMLLLRCTACTRSNTLKISIVSCRTPLLIWGIFLRFWYKKKQSTCVIFCHCVKNRKLRKYFCVFVLLSELNSNEFVCVLCVHEKLIVAFCTQ